MKEGGCLLSRAGVLPPHCPALGRCGPTSPVTYTPYCLSSAVGAWNQPDLQYFLCKRLEIFCQQACEKAGLSANALSDF